MRTEEPAPKSPPSHKKTHRHTHTQAPSERHCKLGVTLRTQDLSLSTRPRHGLATTSLYRRRGDPELFSAVVRSRRSVFEENRRKGFLERKDKMLREFLCGPEAPRRLSPVSEAMKYSIAVVGVQRRRPQRALRAPPVVYSQEKNCLVGKRPCARDGQAAVLYQNCMLIFGGDRHMMTFHDVYFLELDEVLRRLRRA